MAEGTRRQTLYYVNDYVVGTRRTVRGGRPGVANSGCCRSLCWVPHAAGWGCELQSASRSVGSVSKDCDRDKWGAQGARRRRVASLDLIFVAHPARCSETPSFCTACCTLSLCLDRCCDPASRSVGSVSKDCDRDKRGAQGARRRRVASLDLIFVTRRSLVVGWWSASITCSFTTTCAWANCR